MAAQRDARTLLAAGLALCLVGLVLAAWGFWLLAIYLPRIGESSAGLQSDQGSLPGILPENIEQRIIEMRTAAAGAVAFGVLCAAVGSALALSFGPTALGRNPPR